MKSKSTLRSFLAIAGSSLLTITYVSAGTYYWDPNGDANRLFGANGTWAAAGTGNTWSTSPTGDGVGGAAVADYATTTSDDLYFGTPSSSSFTVTGAAYTNLITTVTCDDTSLLVVGDAVTSNATGIPANTTVASITNATTFELSAAATSTQSGKILTIPPLGGTVTIVGAVNANYIYWKGGGVSFSTSPTINFDGTGSLEATGSTVGFPTGTTLTGAGTSMTWKPFNNLNITNITSNSAGSTILQNSPENTGAPGQVVMNAEVNLGIANAPLVFDGGGVRVLSGFPYTDLAALNTAHPVTFTLNKDAALDNSANGPTFTVNMAVNLGTGVFFTAKGGSGATSPIILTSSANIWNEVRISTGILEIDNLNQLGTTTLAAEAPLRFGSGFTSGAGGTLRIVGTGVTSFGTRSMLTTPTKLVGFDIADALNTFTVDQLLDQTTGGFTKSGAGSLIINTTSTYTGLTSVLGGTLSYGTALGIANGPVTVNGATAVLAYGAYDPSVGVVTLTNGTVTGSGTLTSSAAFACNPASPNVFPVGIKLGGILGLNKTGTGTTTLSLDNSGLSGPVSISAGVLNINSTTALGTGAVTISGGTIDATAGATTLSTANPITIGGTVIYGGTNALNLGTGAITMAASRTFTLNGTGSTLTLGGVLTNTAAGAITLTANDAVALSGNTLVLGGIDLSNSVTNKTLTISGTANTTVTGAVTNGASATSALTKTGTGTLTLNGNNTYAGNTTVNTGGTLALVGGSQESAITVNSGGLLGFTLGSPTTSTKNVTLVAGHKVRITGTPTPGVDYTLLTTSGLIINTPDIETPLGTHTLEVEGAGTILVLKALIVSTPFGDWAVLKGLDGTAGKENGKTDDPDGDGKNNNFEFAFNGDPLSGSDNGMIAGLVQDASLPAGNELTLIVAVRDGATFGDAGSPGQVVQTATVDGVTYTIQGTLDLVTIPGSDVSHPSGSSDTAPVATGLPDLTGTDWEYHTFKLDASEGLGDKGFLRAKAE